MAPKPTQIKTINEEQLCLPLSSIGPVRAEPFLTGLSVPGAEEM